MNKYIFIILSAICLSGCKDEVLYEYVTTAKIIFTNDSSHSITVKSIDDGQSGKQGSLEFTIMSGESHTESRTGGITYVPEPLSITGMRCSVIFDNELEIVHGTTASDGTIEHNLCDNNSFIQSYNGKDKISYTYTFTDEDYDRAAAVNKESGE